MSQYKLFEEIIFLSNSDNWDEAVSEWELFDIEMSKEPETCLCGHFPIIELCLIINKINGNQAVVGNCCVNKFLGICSNKIFQSIKRVKKDITKSFNKETIEYLCNKGLLTDWEKNFYIQTWRLRKLTQKRIDKRIEINKKILLKLKV